jgi:hypothetical protein
MRWLRYAVNVIYPVSLAQELCVVVNVLLNKRRDKVVRVIVAVLHSQRHRLSCLCAGHDKVLWQQLLLFVKPVGLSTVDENAQRWAFVLGHEFGSVVLCPCRALGAEVAGKRLLPPRAGRWVADGRERRHGAVPRKRDDVVWWLVRVPPFGSEWAVVHVSEKRLERRRGGAVGSDAQVLVSVICAP